MDLVAAAIDDPRAQPLLRSLEAEYLRDYGPHVAADLGAYDATEFRPPRGALLLVVADGETVAGGALRGLGDGIGEIKRMWTAPEQRRRGHARRILTSLERIAAGVGYRTLRLETGSNQTAAIELYRAAGYRRITPYGRFADDVHCVCFGKRL